MLHTVCTKNSHFSLFVSVKMCCILYGEILYGGCILSLKKVWLFFFSRIFKFIRGLTSVSNLYFQTLGPPIRSVERTPYQPFLDFILDMFTAILETEKFSGSWSPMNEYNGGPGM